jgi:hypothetical protein
VPIPLLDFPPGAVTNIWRALKAVLRADPQLAKVRTLRLWEGEPDDAQPPTTSEMPWVRVTPVRTPMRLAEERALGADLRFKYELAVQGTSYENLAMLFDAFQGALKFDAPVDQSVALQALRAAGATTYEFTEAAVGPLRTEQPPDPDGRPQPAVQNLVAVGFFTIRALIPC